jgi:hypothetical protein
VILRSALRALSVRLARKRRVTCGKTERNLYDGIISGLEDCESG